jgi:hypothetical protein
VDQGLLVKGSEEGPDLQAAVVIFPAAVAAELVRLEVIVLEVPPELAA